MRAVSRKLSGTLPLASKNWIIAKRSANDTLGREVVSVDVLTSAGPPRVVPRSSGYDAKGPLSADALYARPLEKELKKSS